MKRLLAITMVVGITAAVAGPVSAAPTDNGCNTVGVILSENTPEDFHHGEEAARAVPQAEDGRGDEITAFTSFFAGC